MPLQLSWTNLMSGFSSGAQELTAMVKSLLYPVLSVVSWPHGVNQIGLKYVTMGICGGNWDWCPFDTSDSHDNECFSLALSIPTLSPTWLRMEMSMELLLPLAVWLPTIIHNQVWWDSRCLIWSVMSNQFSCEWLNCIPQQGTVILLI